jgi:glycosyltransferase involved in cell wall biosynthesis
MMEAMACALPCVSTDRSGAVDVARDGREALFYKVGDLAAMEAHVRYLLDHPEEGRAMGQRAQARLAEFATGKSLARFEHIVEAALDGKRTNDV